jgi:protease-4
MKQFFLNVLSSLTAFALFFGLGFVFLIALVASFASSDTVVETKSDSFLHIPISGSIPQYVQKSEMDDLLDIGRDLSLHDIIFGLEAAASDQNILGVVLHVNHTMISMAKAQEIKAALVRFREESEKPIYAFIERGGNREYFLATAADSIYMQPEGNLILTPLQISMDFYKESLAHFGIEASFIPVGTFKSAPEVYTKTKMSKPNRMQYTRLLSQFQNLLKDDLELERKLSKKAVSNVMKQGWFSTATAVAHGLVDRAMYWDDIQRELHGSAKYYRGINLKKYRETISFGGSYSKQIAVIYAEGAIMEGNDGQNLMMGGTIGSSRVVRNIRSAMKNSRIKGIVLRIDSPGGSSLASDIIWRELEQASREKPVYISVGGAAASGGYYLAIAGQKIFAQESSIVGSIGVYLGKYNINGLRSDWLKVKSDKILLDKENDLNFFDATRSFTARERSILTADLTNFYNRFVAKAAEGRGMENAAMGKLAEGRVWTAKDGKENGLIDEFGGLLETIAALENELGIRDGARLNFYPKTVPFLEELSGKSLLDSKMISPEKVREEIRKFNAVQSWALWPADLKVN